LLKAPRAIGIDREGEDVVQIHHATMLQHHIRSDLHGRGAILEVSLQATTGESLRRGRVLDVDLVTDQGDAEQGEDVG